MTKRFVRQLYANVSNHFKTKKPSPDRVVNVSFTDPALQRLFWVSTFFLLLGDDLVTKTYSQISGQHTKICISSPKLRPLDCISPTAKVSTLIWFILEAITPTQYSKRKADQCAVTLCRLHKS